jgi:hypothetical protein
VQVVSLSWGLVTSKLLQFRNKLDWVISRLPVPLQSAGKKRFYFVLKKMFNLV